MSYKKEHPPPVGGLTRTLINYPALKRPKIRNFFSPFWLKSPSEVFHWVMIALSFFAFAHVLPVNLPSSKLPHVLRIQGWRKLFWQDFLNLFRFPNDPGKLFFWKFTHKTFTSNSQKKIPFDFLCVLGSHLMNWRIRRWRIRWRYNHIYTN